MNLVSVLTLTMSTLFVNVSYAATFDFTAEKLGNITAESAYGSVGMSSDGIDLTVQAYTINNENGVINSKALIDGAGLGVYMESGHGESLGVMSNVDDGSHGTLDAGSGSRSTDPDEGLLFTFGQKVSLDYINLDFFSGDDDFNLTVDGVTFIVDYSAADAANNFVTSTDGQQDHFLFNKLIGKEFLIWADGSSDSFTISDLKVSAVPLPAAIWLMGPALFGIFSLSRKRKQEV